MTDPQRMELKKLRESADGPIHSGNYWSHEEKERARQLFNMNFGISEIALELGRGEIATCQQLIQLGMYTPKKRQKKRRSYPCGCLCKDCTADPDDCILRRKDAARKDML